MHAAITSFSLNPHIKKKSAASDIFDDTVQTDSCIRANLLGARIFSIPWASMDAVHFPSVSGWPTLCQEEARAQLSCKVN